jgi:N-acyl-L-homoserine lactone synthetase
MIQLLEMSPRPLEHAVLRRMFEARKQVFVDLLGWDVPVLHDRYEIDQFDHEEARYLVLTDDEGRHLASARLLPTTRPHLLGDLFPELCDGPLPSGPGVFEITRFCLDRSLCAVRRRRVRDALVCAIARHARATGITRYSAIAGVGWFQQILAFGWRCRPLGLPKQLGDETLVALEIAIEADTLAKLAAAGIVDQPAMRAVAA